MKKKYYSGRRRVRKAYWTTFVILMSYLRLKMASKILGQKYYDSKINNLNIKSANRVKNTILELEGLFIKVGQLLSILTNFLPKSYHEPLNSLQNQLPPRSHEEIRQRIQSELGQSIEDLFEDFDVTPIATASIGQAHRAKLKDGTAVIVKVQHFNIEKIAEVDLDIIKKLTRLASYIFDIKGLDYAYEQIKLMIEDELDFKKEAESMTIIGKNLEDFDRLIIPKVHSSHSRGRVMVTTFCEGVKISDLEQLNKWEIDKTDLAERLIAVYVEMVLRNGFYHADPHPGNILVQEDGSIVLLDFGAVAHVQSNLRKGIPRLVESIAKNDADGTIEALKSMDFIADTKDASRIAEKMIAAFRHFIEEEVKVQGLDFKNIQEINPFETGLFKLKNELGLKMMANTFQVPKDYVLLNRTATLLLGICSALDSSLNPLVVVRPHIQTLIKEEQGDIMKYIVNSLQSTLTSAIAIPETLQGVLQQAKKGQLELNVIGTDERTQMNYFLGQQFFFAFLSVFSVIIGIWMRQVGDFELSKYSFIASALFGFLMWRNMRKAKKINQRVGLRIRD
ncbi:MAG: ABC1 kinase family protein [Saprospiraceae bacterium]